MKLAMIKFLYCKIISLKKRYKIKQLTLIKKLLPLVILNLFEINVNIHSH